MLDHYNKNHDQIEIETSMKNLNLILAMYVLCGCLKIIYLELEVISVFLIVLM